MQYQQAVIQVFCKAPVAGLVKTRLTPGLSAEQAAEVYRQLTVNTLDLVCQPSLCAVQLWCSPDDRHPFFNQLAKTYPLTLQIQSNGDLGQRMNHAINTGLAHYEQVILIGTDCPSLSQTEFHQAIKALQQEYDAVTAPTEDGGYSLIGLNKPAPAIFKAIDWSTPKVMQQTRNKFVEMKLRYHELALQWDVDNHNDYLRWLAQ